MPKQSLKAELNTFVKGFITEASPLNFPPNASVEEVNFDLKRTGARFRRNGMDFEEDHQLIPLTVTGINHIPETFIWTEANGIVDNNISVVQFGDTLYFFDMNQTSLSGDGYLGSLSLTNEEASFIPVDVAFSFCSLDGYLVVVAGQESVAVVSYDGTTFSVEYGRIQVRDVWGIEV